MNTKSCLLIGADLTKKMMETKKNKQITFQLKNPIASRAFLIYLKKPKQPLEKSVFKIIAKINKVVLPSFTKQRLDLAKASKLQLAVIGWRYFVTSKALG